MTRSALVSIALALLVSQAALAQENLRDQQLREQQLEESLARELGFSQHLFPPELVMRYQRTLQLTEEQRTTIRDAVTQLQTSVQVLQWDLFAENQALSELLESESIDAGSALQQLDRVLEIEGQIKRTHFRLLMQIKNTLTAEQQAMLREIQGRTLWREGEWRRLPGGTGEFWR